MDATPSGEGPAATALPHHIRLAGRIKDGVRDLGIQFALLSHRVGARLDLRDADLECLELVVRCGPIGPTALARRAGLHPATLTGVLDRLERGGWVVRTPHPADRRSVLVRAVEEKEPEVAFLFSGLAHAIDDLCARYGDADLAMIADFLQRASTASRAATDDLARNGRPSAATRSAQ